MADAQANQEDVKLMTAIASGDAAALSSLYDRYNRLIYTLCLRVLKNRDEAEDLLVEVFQEVWQKSGRYDATRGSPLTYLTTLTRSRAIDRLRSLGKTRPVELSDAVVTASDAADPAETADLTEQRKCVIDALNELDPVYRQAVELSFYDGLSHSEIAAQLNKPLGTVKTYIRQGLIRLRDKLRTNSQPRADVRGGQS